jgi:hypothetical protein
MILLLGRVVRLFIANVVTFESYITVKRSILLLGSNIFYLRLSPNSTTFKKEGDMLYTGPIQTKKILPNSIEKRQEEKLCKKSEHIYPWLPRKISSTFYVTDAEANTRYSFVFNIDLRRLFRIYFLGVAIIKLD